MARAWGVTPAALRECSIAEFSGMVDQLVAELKAQPKAGKQRRRRRRRS